MPAVSQAQQQAAGAALAAKKSGKGKSGLKGASKSMYDMSTSELEKIAGTSRKGLPKHVSERLKEFIKKTVNEILIESEGEPTMATIKSNKLRQFIGEIIKEVLTEKNIKNEAWDTKNAVQPSKVGMFKVKLKLNLKKN